MLEPAAPAFIPAQSIDDVVRRLDAIVDRAIIERDRLGFFAVLYRTVTLAVRDGITAGQFDDGPRMERLDVAFANRYLRAFHEYKSGARPTRCWHVVFAAGSRSRVVILQHLLLGMNAHINLDLGIAAAEVCPGDGIAALEGDFNAINQVLSTLETGVEGEVCSLSPWIDRLDHIDPRSDGSWRTSASTGRGHARGQMRNALPSSQATSLRSRSTTSTRPSRFSRTSSSDRSAS